MVPATAHTPSHHASANRLLVQADHRPRFSRIRQMPPHTSGAPRHSRGPELGQRAPSRTCADPYAFTLFDSDVDEFDRARILVVLQYPDSGFDEQSDFETFARHSKGAPSAGHSLFQGDGTQRPTRVTRTRRDHAELIAMISRERVLELLYIPQKEAARQCGVCLTTFKKICRGYVTPSTPIWSPPLHAVRTPPPPNPTPELQLYTFRVSRNGLVVNSGAPTRNARLQEVSRCLRL
jgi:hypothetical protein